MSSEREERLLKKTRFVILVVATIMAVASLAIFSSSTDKNSQGSLNTQDLNKRGDPGLIFELSERPVPPTALEPQPADNSTPLLANPLAADISPDGGGQSGKEEPTAD
jgi:hypothetical protein